MASQRKERLIALDRAKRVSIKFPPTSPELPTNSHSTSPNLNPEEYDLFGNQLLQKYPQLGEEDEMISPTVGASSKPPSTSSENCTESSPSPSSSTPSPGLSRTNSASSPNVFKPGTAEVSAYEQLLEEAKKRGRTQTIMKSVKTLFSRGSGKSSSPSAAPNLHTVSPYEFVEQMERETSNSVDIEQALRKYISSVQRSSNQFTKEGTLYIQKSKGHYKERWLQITYDNNTGTEMVVWRNAQKEGKPLLKYDLNEFKLQHFGCTTANLRDLKREKKQYKVNIFALLYFDSDVKKDVVFCTPDEKEYADWNEALSLIEMKNFALQEWKYAPSFMEDLENRVEDQRHLLMEEKKMMSAKMGHQRFNSILNGYTSKLDALKHRKAVL